MSTELRDYLLEKQAVGGARLMAPLGASIWRRVGGLLKSKLPSKTAIREGLIGTPRKFMHEVGRGKALDKGSLLRQSFHAPSTLSKALFYGLPAYETINIATDDEGAKAKRIGSTLGGSALGLAAWKPFGIVGSILADTAGRRVGGLLGGAAGHVGSKLTGTEAPPQAQQKPINPLSPILTTGRAAGQLYQGR